MQDGLSSERTTDKGLSLQVDQDIGALTLTAIGATRRFKSAIDLDVDGSNSAVVSLRSRPATAIKENSVELRLQNQAGSAVEFILGGYYFDQVIADRNVLPATIKPIATTVTLAPAAATAACRRSSTSRAPTAPPCASGGRRRADPAGGRRGGDGPDGIMSSIASEEENDMSDISGSYDVVARTPMGDQTMALTIAVDGDAFTGTSVGQMGSADISGAVAGDTITWQQPITVPMPLTLDCKAVVTGDALEGTIDTGAFGSFPITGRRAA